MPYQKNKHDVGIQYSGSSTMGLMLAQDRNGRPIYRRFDDESLSEQRATGTAGIGWYPPGKELPIILDDFGGGISSEVYSSSLSSRYFNAIDMDCRFGNAIAGLKAVTATKPTATNPTLTDGAMELWDDVSTLTNWTISAGTITREGTGEYVQAGTYSCYLDPSTAAEIYQDLATTQIQGRRFTFTCYVYGAATEIIKIGINDGVNSTFYSAQNKTSSAWEQLTVTATLSRAATRLRLSVIRENTIQAAFCDTATITRASLGTTTCNATYGGQEYINFGGLLAKIQSSDGTIAAVHEFPSPITSLKVGVDGLLYIALESSGETIEDCEDAWNESVDSDATVSVDTGDYKVGSGSNKFVIAAGMAAGDVIATEVIDLDDEKWGGYDGVSMWIKCSVATSLGNLKLLLDTDVTADPSSDEVLSIPALTANVWTKVYLDLASPSNTEAIISVGLEYDADLGACTIHIDQIQGEHRYYSIGTGGDAVKAGAGDVGEDGYAKFLALRGTTMWKFLPPNNLYSATNPADATNWSTVTTVDSGENNITDLAVRENVLYMMKEDKPYYLDGSDAVQVLVDDTVSLQSSDSGEQAYVWHGYLLMPWGSSSLLRYDGTTTDWIEPALYSVNLGDVDGQVQGLAGDDQWLYAIVDNSTKVEIMAGRQATSGWIWHGSLAELTLTGCERAFVSSVYEKRLWISSTVSGEALTYYKLYANYGDVTNDTNRNYPTNGELYTPQLHGNFKGDTKAFIKVTAELGHAYDADIYFECHYQVQGDTSWTDAGDFRGTASNRSATLYIPDDSGSNHPSSEWIKFKLIEKTDDATKTPVLIKLDVRAMLYSTKRRLIECTVRGADHPLNKQGAKDSITGVNIATNLITADDATWPVEFYDPFGTTKNVKVLSVQEIFGTHYKDATQERQWRLILQEVALS